MIRMGLNHVIKTIMHSLSFKVKIIQLSSTVEFNSNQICAVILLTVLPAPPLTVSSLSPYKT